MPESLGITPISIIQRLSVYLRNLRDARADGAEFISSNELAERNGYTSAQVRKDFACFGSFGKKGKGYHIDSLISTIEGILGLTAPWRVALLGLGHLGEALAGYKGFHRSGFDIVAIFDTHGEPQSNMYNNIPVYSIAQMAQVAKKEKIDIAIVAVPSQMAKDVIQKVIDAGIKGILNFTDVRVPVPQGFILKNVSLAAELETISYYLTNPGWPCRG